MTLQLTAILVVIMNLPDERNDKKNVSSSIKEEHIWNGWFELSVKFMRNNDRLRRTYAIYLLTACGLWIWVANDKYSIYRRHRSLALLFTIFYYVIVGWNIYAANAANWNCVVKNIHTHIYTYTARAGETESRSHQLTQSTFEEFRSHFDRCPFSGKSSSNVIIITTRHSPYLIRKINYLISHAEREIETKKAPK